MRSAIWSCFSFIFILRTVSLCSSLTSSQFISSSEGSKEISNCFKSSQAKHEILGLIPMMIGRDQGQESLRRWIPGAYLRASSIKLKTLWLLRWNSGQLEEVSEQNWKQRRIFKDSLELESDRDCTVKNWEERWEEEG